MATQNEIIDWYFRYKVNADDMTNLESLAISNAAGMMEGLLSGAAVYGLQASPIGSMNVGVNAGIAIGATGYLHVLSSSATASFTTPSSLPVRSLIVARPLLTNTEYITDPTDPFSMVPLKTELGSEILVLAGAEATAPTYPATEPNDVVIVGVATRPGQTSIADVDLDFSVRDTVAKNAAFLQNVAQFDDRLRPYRLTNQIVGVRPSQLVGSNPKGFKSLALNYGATFPLDGSGDFTPLDTFIDFQSGTITGGDEQSSDFTPTIPTTNNAIVAAVTLDINNELSITYGTTGSRAQCYDGIENQKSAGAGSLSIPSSGQPICFVLLFSNNGTSITELDVFDARGIVQAGSAPVPATPTVAGIDKKPIAFYARRTTNQLINNGVDVKIQVNDEVFDTNNNYDPTTNYRFTPTQAGIYQVSLEISMDNLTDQVSVQVQIWKNGAVYESNSFQTSVSGATNSDPLSVPVQMNGTTDYLEAYVAQTDSSAKNLVRARFSAFSTVIS